MNHSRATRSLAIAVAALALAAGTAHAQFQDRTIRASFTLGKDHSLGIGLAKVQACVAQKSGGKLKLQPYYDASIGTDGPAIQQLRSGTLDMVITQTSFMTSMIPEAGVFDLPFLVHNEKEGDAIMDGKPGELLSAKLPAVGLVNLAYWENGFRNTTTSKRPVNRLEDFTGLKLRVVQNAIMVESFKELGAFAVPMAFTELYAALETKAVDGQENPFNITELSKFQEVQKYLSLTRHMYNPAMVVYSKKLFDQLSPLEQATLRDCAQETRLEQRRINRQQANESLGRLKTQGMIVNDVSAAEVQRMRDRVQPVYVKQAPVIGTEMMSAVDTELKKVRAQ